MIRFSVLLDENVSGRLDRALRRLGTGVEVLRVGHEGAPPVGASDPDLLQIAEASGSAIVTCDRSTFPDHAAAHVASGRHTFGAFVIRYRAALGHVIDDLLLIVAASEPGEWRDQVTLLPLVV